MSEPKVVQRYSPLHMSWSAGMKPDDEGMCVLYSDYAALAKRVVELEGQCRETNDILTSRNNELFTKRQEVTQLRKRIKKEADTIHDLLVDEDWLEAQGNLAEGFLPELHDRLRKEVNDE